MRGKAGGENEQARMGLPEAERSAELEVVLG